MTWDTAAKDIEFQQKIDRAYEDLVQRNAKLARAVGAALKKQTGAESTRQSYVGTGSAAHRRQLYVRWPTAVVDLWFEATHVRVGGVVCNGLPGVHRTQVSWVDANGLFRPEADVVADLVALLSKALKGGEG